MPTFRFHSLMNGLRRLRLKPFILKDALHAHQQFVDFILHKSPAPTLPLAGKRTDGQRHVRAESEQRGGQVTIQLGLTAERLKDSLQGQDELTHSLRSGVFAATDARQQATAISACFGNNQHYRVFQTHPYLVKHKAFYWKKRNRQDEQD